MEKLPSTTSSSTTTGRTSDRLAYVKNGTLFGLETDPELVYGAVLADTYQDSQYLTVLGTDGMLHDLNESIHLPESFTNRGSWSWLII